jgi:hypothetical protein
VIRHRARPALRMCLMAIGLILVLESTNIRLAARYFKTLAANSGYHI